jgi:hypothetical protein
MTRELLDYSLEDKMKRERERERGMCFDYEDEEDKVAALNR